MESDEREIFKNKKCGYGMSVDSAEGGRKVRGQGRSNLVRTYRKTERTTNSF